MTSCLEYRLKIKKGNMEIEVQGDKDWVENKFKELLDTVKTVTPIGPTPPVPTSTHSPTLDPTPTGLPESIGELLILKGSPSKHTDRALVFSYWLSKAKKTATYNMTDIEQCYLEALIAKPANVTDVMNSNQKKGYLIEAPKKDGLKAWRLSSSGENTVEEMK